MIMKHLMYKSVLLTMLFVAFGITSCSKKEAPIVTREQKVEITVKNPIDVPEGKLSITEATFTNISNGTNTKADPSEIGPRMITITLKEGMYKAHIIAKLQFKNKDGIDANTTIEIKEEIEVKHNENAAYQIQLTPNYQPSSSGFVIDEIYFSPSLTPEGKSFTYVEQYIKITNNSNETLYADGIAIVESAFLTNNKWDYKPNIMNEAFAIDAIALIPGNGSEHPVAPGASLIIANNAQNHTKINPNAVDLSQANFEWYDESPNPKFQDEDNLEVPNLDKWYASTATVHGFHQRGVKAVAIAKMDTNKDEYLDKYKYDYTYLFTFKDYSKEMSGSAYKVPNAWIIDAVNLSIPEGDKGFAWLVTDPSLDSGWTGWNDSFNDKTAAGLAVRRKIQSEGENGRKYLMDTNNSTNDFERRVKPSLKK